MRLFHVLDGLSKGFQCLQQIAEEDVEDVTTRLKNSSQVQLASYARPRAGNEVHKKLKLNPSGEKETLVPTHPVILLEFIDLDVRAGSVKVGQIVKSTSLLCPRSPSDQK